VASGNYVPIDRDSFEIAVVSKYYGVPFGDTIDNDFWESKLSPDDMYFKDKDKKFHDFYYVCFEGGCYLLKKDDKFQEISERLRQVIHTPDDEFFNKKVNSVLYENHVSFPKTQKLPRELFKYLEVEEIGIDWLRR
jgi:hypothetical protein